MSPNASDLGPQPELLSWRASPVLVLRLVLGALFVSTALGVSFALTHRGEFIASFPGAARPATFGAFILVALAGMVAAVGLWRWRRWAIPLYALVGAVSLALDVSARAPAVHQAAVAVSLVVVVGLVYMNRQRFVPRTQSAPSN